MKSLIFALAILGLITYSYAAVTAAPACAAGTNGFDDAGTCKYCHPSCLTCTGPAATQCATCDGTMTKSGTNTCACTTGTNRFKWDATNKKYTCVAPAAASGWVCGSGYGMIDTANGGTTKAGCLPCATGQAGTCQKCDDNTTADTVKNQCTACFSGSTTAITKCVPTTDKFIVAFQGEVDACPAGYVADTDKVCQPCGPSCTACAATALNTCTGCKVGDIIVNNLCVASTATGDNACDATCKAQKCQTAKNKCSECADGHKFTAEQTCTKVPTVPGCKTLEDGKTDECKECETGYTVSTDKKKCWCEKTKYIKTTDYTAKTATAAAVYWKQECTACDPVCATGKKCDHAKNGCIDDTAAEPKIDCEDTAQKDSGCTTCKKATEGDNKDKFVCSACRTGTKLGSTGVKLCECANGTAKESWDKVNKKCIACAAACADGKTCNIKTAGTAGKDAVVECGAAPTPAGGSSNGILISAISMILAVILA